MWWERGKPRQCWDDGAESGAINHDGVRRLLGMKKGEGLGVCWWDLLCVLGETGLHSLMKIHFPCRRTGGERVKPLSCREEALPLCEDNTSNDSEFGVCVCQGCSSSPFSISHTQQLLFFPSSAHSPLVVASILK